MINDQPQFEIEMPFLTVVSRGGPHDDNAYVAGWEMGALDAELAHRRPALHEQLIHAANHEQADLIGMKHGYEVDTVQHNDEWSSVRLTRTREET